MAITKYVLDPDRGLPPEELARLKELEKELENWEDEYDEDCPELTDEQIKNLKRADPGKKVSTIPFTIASNGSEIIINLRDFPKPVINGSEIIINLRDFPKPVIKGTPLILKHDRIFLDRDVVKKKVMPKGIQNNILDNGLNSHEVSENKKLKNFRKVNPG